MLRNVVLCQLLEGMSDVWHPTATCTLRWCHHDYIFFGDEGCQPQLLSSTPTRRVTQQQQPHALVGKDHVLNAAERAAIYLLLHCQWPSGTQKTCSARDALPGDKEGMQLAMAPVRNTCGWITKTVNELPGGGTSIASPGGWSVTGIYYVCRGMILMGAGIQT